MEPSNTDADDFTSPFQLSKSFHRDTYAALNPKNPTLSAFGKVVIITNVNGPIGVDRVKAWAMAGAARIILVGRDEETLNISKRLYEDTFSLVAFMAHSADVTSESSVKNLYDEIAKHVKVVDVLINDAAIWNNQTTGVVEPTQWWHDFECHVKGPYLMSHYFIQRFGAKGTIINFSSLAIGLVMPGLSAHSASGLAMAKTSEYLQKEHPSLRVFCCMQRDIECQSMEPTLPPMYFYNSMLTSTMSLYLSTPRADYLKGSLVCANWDIEEMEQHKDEIVKNQLLKLGFLNAKLGPEGHPWET